MGYYCLLCTFRRSFSSSLVCRRVFLFRLSQVNAQARGRDASNTWESVYRLQFLSFLPLLGVENSFKMSHHLEEYKTEIVRICVLLCLAVEVEVDVLYLLQ